MAAAVMALVFGSIVLVQSLKRTRKGRGSFLADGPEGSNVTADDASTTVAPPAAVPTATTSTPALDECSPVIARMSRGVDQSYLDNPDELVFGATFCKFCANGTMVCDARFSGGESPLIASHIHLVSGEDGEDGARGVGPAVVSFCGTPGLLEDGATYSAPCQDWAAKASTTVGMAGTPIAGAGGVLTAAQRVADILRRPGMYYFDFHSTASWKHWRDRGEEPRGLCRGMLERRD